MYANGQDLIRKQKSSVCGQGAAIMRDLKCRTDVSAMRAASVTSMAFFGILITIGCCCIGAASSTGVQPPYSLHENIRVPPVQHTTGIESFSSLVYAIQSNVSDSSLHHNPIPPVSPLNLQASSQQPQTSATSSSDGNSSQNIPIPVYYPPLHVSHVDALVPQDTIHPSENPHQEVVPPQPSPNESVGGVINQASPNGAEDTQTSNVETLVAPFDDKNDENPLTHTVTSDHSHPAESLVSSQIEGNSSTSLNTDSANGGDHPKDDYHYEYDNINVYDDGDSDVTALYQDNGHEERLEEVAVSTEEDTYSNVEADSFTAQDDSLHSSKQIDGTIPSVTNESSADSTLIANDLFKDDSLTSHNNSEGEDYYSEVVDGSITEPSLELLGNSLEPIGMPTSEHIVTVTPPTIVEGAEHVDYYLDYNDTLPSESTINEGEDGNHDINYDYYDGQEPHSKTEENTGNSEQQPDQSLHGDDPLLDGNEKVQEVSVFDADQDDPLADTSSSQLDTSRQDSHQVGSEVLEIQPEIPEDQPEEDVFTTTTTIAPKAGGSVSVVSYTDSEVDYQAKAQQQLKEQPINGDVHSVNEESDIPTTTTTTSTTARPTSSAKSTTPRGYAYAPRTVPSLYSTTTKAVTTQKTTTTAAPVTTRSTTALPTTSTSQSPLQNPSASTFSGIETGDSDKLKTITDTSFTVNDSHGNLETSKEDSTTQHSTAPSMVDDVHPEENTEPMPPTTTSSPTQSIVDVIQSLNLPEPTLFGEMPIIVNDDHLNIPAPNISEPTDVFQSEDKVSTDNGEKSHIVHDENIKTTPIQPHPITSTPTSSEISEVKESSPKDVAVTSIAESIEPIISAADAILTESSPVYSTVLPEFVQSTTTQSKAEGPEASYEHAAADNVKSAFDAYSSSTSTTTSKPTSATTTTASTTVTSKTELSNTTAAIKENQGDVGAPTESVPHALLPSGFSTEEPVSVVLVPLKSRNLSRGRKLGSLFDQIFERQKKTNKTETIAIDPAIKNITDIIVSKTNTSVADVANTTAIPETSAENVTASEPATTKPPVNLLRRRFPTLSRKPFLSSRAPTATRAPFKINPRKTSDILKQARVTLKPIGRRTNPHAEYPSDPDNRPGETTEATPPTTTTKRIVTTLSPYFLWGQSVEVACTLRIHDGVEWSQDFEDHSSPAYRDLSNDIGKELDALFRRSDFGNRYKGIQIEGFSRGSVIVDYTLYLTEEDDPVETPLLWEALSKALENGTNMGAYTVDPGNLSFEVIRKITPPPEILNDGLLLPHWAIAVIVIAAASLLFLIILCLALTRNKRGVKRKYANVLKEGSIADRAKDWDKSAYDNLGASSSIYDINDTWDEKKLKQQQRSYNNYNLYSVHPPSTGSGHYAPKSTGSGHYAPKSTGSGQYGMKKSASQMSDHFPPEDPYSQGRYYDSWRSDWSKSARGSSKPPDYDTTF